MPDEPITGRGSSYAAKTATAHLEAVRGHGEGPFDCAFTERLVSPEAAEAYRAVVDAAA